MTRNYELIIQFFFVNIVFTGGLFLYNGLPRIINVLVVLFFAPLALLFAMKSILKKIFPDTDTDNLIISLAIITVTIWLPLILTQYMTSVPDYVAYLKNPIIVKTSLDHISNFSHALYFELTDAINVPEYSGMHYTTTHKKNAFEDLVFINRYYVVPLVPDKWHKEEPVSTWLTESVTDEQHETPREPLIIKASIPDNLDAVRCHDPHEIVFAELAIENARQKHSLNIGKDLLILKTSQPARYAINTGGKQLLLIVLAVNILWSGLPVILSFSSGKKRFH